MRNLAAQDISPSVSMESVILDNASLVVEEIHQVHAVLHTWVFLVALLLK